MRRAWLLGAALALGLAFGAQRGLERVPPPRVDVDLLLVPPPALVKGAATGFENLVADGLWLGLMQYYGDRVTRSERRAANLKPMLDLITQLDPKFEFAYWLGGWALLDNGEPEAAVSLLSAAARANPQDWRYLYWRGMLRFLGTADYLAAAADFKKVQAIPGAPRFAGALEARMYQTAGRDEFALGVWRSMAESATDGATREIARRNLARVKEELAGKRPKAFRKRAVRS